MKHVEQGVKWLSVIVLHILMAPAIGWGFLIQIWEAGYVIGRMQAAMLAVWADED